MLQNSRGVFFLRSPKRRRQPPPDAQGLGILKPVKLVHLHVRTFVGDEIDIFFKYSYAHFPCSHSSFGCTGTHYVCRLEKLQFHKMLYFFRNLQMSIRTFSMRRIRPYGHIRPKIQVLAHLGGWGFCRILFPIYIPIGPVWGLLLGSLNFIRLPWSVQGDHPHKTFFHILIRTFSM